MAVNLTPGAISMLVTGKHTVLEPVVQVIKIKCSHTETEVKGNRVENKKWYGITLSDGLVRKGVIISEKINEMVRSKQLQKGSVVQLTHYSSSGPRDYRTMAVNLTPGAILKLSSGECTWNDLKPVVQLIYIDSRLKRSKNGKQWHLVVLSDGSFSQLGCIPVEILISNKLQKGSIVQLTMFQFGSLFYSKGEITTLIKSGIWVFDLNLLRTTCDIIGDPKRLPDNETPLVERTTPTIPDQDHANSHHVEEPPTSIQNPLTSTQKCSSSSPTQNKKRKLQSSDDAISGFGKDISKLVSMIVEKTIEDGLGACYEKFGTLEEGVSKMTKLMMEKNKEDVVGFKKVETLEQDVSKMMKLMMEKNKEVDAGFIKLETLKEDVSKMVKMVTEKSKEVDVGFKKLETLEEDVSKLSRMMIEKNKEDDVGACYKKLETIEDVSKIWKMMMEKNKEDDMGACIKKLDKMGWGAEEPIYDTALLLFGQSADYRKLWLHLKPESCGKWVKNAGSMFGLLD